MLQPLLEGVRTDAVNELMFPKDVIANAPRILSDLRTIFPPQEGKFLIGPMAKVGWGTPALVSISLGIIIEIPGDTVVPGVLKVALPTEQTPLLVLQVNFVGVLEADKKRLYFRAGLFESHVLGITIDGELGLLMAWGDDPNFVVSVGGFHPQFSPPALPFPTPQRVALNLLNRDNARILVTGYFAVTTNTAQFGAAAELYFGLSACSVSGHIAFDALFQFSPLYFIVQISGEVGLKVFGIGLFSIGLRFSLEGPTPWRATGSGSISFFFFDVSADFDITWGESHDTTLLPVDVMPLLRAELEKLENWTVHLPQNNNLLVSLRRLDESSADLVLHPVGSLRVSQKAAPLDVTIAKVGNQNVADANKFSVTPAGDTLTKTADTSEWFAMGQFQEMDNSAKLNHPACERQSCGLELTIQGEQIAASGLAKRVVRYETVILDSNYRRLVVRPSQISERLFEHFLDGSTIGKSELSVKHAKQRQPFSKTFEVNADLYTVAMADTNRPYPPEAPKFSSEALAREYLFQETRRDPNLAANLHVIPQAEVNISV